MTTRAFYELRLRLIRNQLTDGDRLLLAECMRLVAEKMRLHEVDPLADFDARHPMSAQLFGEAPAPAAYVEG